MSFERWASRLTIEEDFLGAGSGVRRADDRAVRPTCLGGKGGGAVVIINLAGLALAILLTVFLVFALLFPERF